MCLRISDRHRTCFGPKWKPKKLHSNLTVYKVLYRDSNGNLRTPYTDDLIELRYGQCIRPRISKDDFAAYDIPYTTYGATKSNNAHHAYVSQQDALQAAEIIVRFRRHRTAYVYTAIIPSGAYVWYGVSGDICSNQMTITDEFIRI